jgi:acyl-CoA synthetase (AMP-forming)/AMP-acid ligase II
VATAAVEAAQVSTLVTALRQALPLYMVPSSVDLREELPRSPNGKYDRTLLKAQVSG